MIKNIIFDIGNVLSDFCWEKYLSEKGFSDEMVNRIGNASVRSEAWYEFDKGVYSEQEVIDLFIKNDPGIANELHEAFDHVEGMVRLFPTTFPWLEDLRSRGYKLYYLSNYSYKVETQCPDSVSFIPFMDGGILSYKVKLTKPDPLIYRLLLNTYGLKADESVFLDDTKKNVDAAIREGIHGIQVLSQEQAKRDLDMLLGM